MLLLRAGTCNARRPSVRFQGSCVYGQMCLPSGRPPSQVVDCGWRDGTVTTQGATMTDQPRLSLVVSWHSCIGSPVVVSREPWRL